MDIGLHSLDDALFAAREKLLGLPAPAIVMAALVLLFLSTVLLVLVKYYKRCPSNRILVIYGKTGSGRSAIISHGGAKFVVPLLQDYGWLFLEPMRLEISPPDRPADKGLGFPVPRFFTVAIGTTPELMQNAADRLLGLSPREIRQPVDDIITAQLSKLIDSMVADGTRGDPEAFFFRLETMLEEELKQLGLVLISFRRE